jgi:hypothetical protein
MWRDKIYITTIKVQLKLDERMVFRPREERS